MSLRRAVYPGSFDPPTVAHFDLSRAVIEQRRCDVIVWSLSRVTLGKDNSTGPSIEQRAVVLREIAEQHDWLDVQVTDSQLLADVAEGFDVVVMGADKWVQINEVQWYADASERDRALASLPELAIADRPPHKAPSEHRLEFSGMELVSSSAARAGAHHLVLAEAAASGLWLS